MAIKKFTHGPKILVEFGNSILDEVEASTPKAGVRTRVNRYPGGTSIDADQGGGGTPSGWPWHIFNTTVTTTGQVQVNGGDGFVAQLNSFVCNVNGDPSDTLISGVYPQLAVTGNGVVYGYAVPTTAGTASPLISLDLFYGGTLPSVDTANPATYFPMLVATITNYATDMSGNVSFTVNNVYGSAYGPSTLIYCGGGIQVY